MPLNPRLTPRRRLYRYRKHLLLHLLVTPLLTTLISSSRIDAAWGQGESAHPTGVFTPGHLLRSTTPSGSPYMDAGAATPGATTNYRGASELGITNAGTPLCINSGPTNNPYNQLCLGHDASGNGLITLNSYGGLSDKTFSFDLNGTLYELPFAVGGIVGPNSSTTGDLAVFNNSSGNLLRGASGSIVTTTMTADSDHHLEIDKTPTPTNWFGNTQAGPTFVVQQKQDQPLGANISEPGSIFQFNVTGNGTISGGGISQSFWPGVESLMYKQGDGSAHSFTGTSQLQAYGPSGYNEGTIFAGTYFNVGSLNGYLSGTEVLVADSIDGGTSHFKTRLHGVIGRVAKYDTSILSSDSLNSNSFQATSEGTQPVGSVLQAYDIAGHGWQYGIDLSGAHIASGKSLIMQNQGAINIVNTTSSAQVPILGVDPSDTTYIRPAAAGGHIYQTDFAGNPVIDLNVAGSIWNSNATVVVTKAASDLANFNSTGANAAAVFVNAQAGGQQATISFQEAATTKWQIGAQTDNSFFLFDVATSTNAFIVNSGRVTVGESTNLVNFANSATVAAVPGNFSAIRTLHIQANGVDYYIPAATATW